MVTANHIGSCELVSPKLMELPYFIKPFEIDKSLRDFSSEPSSYSTDIHTQERIRRKTDCQHDELMIEINGTVTIIIMNLNYMWKYFRKIPRVES